MQKTACQKFATLCEYEGQPILLSGTQRIMPMYSARRGLMRSEMTDPEAARIRIVTIDEHELFRVGLNLLLARQPGFEIVASASTWSDAMPLLQRKHPDVILLSISSHDAAGINSLPQLLAASEGTSILAISELRDPELFGKAVRLGAAGVLLRNSSAEMLVKAIECVNAGEAWLDRSITGSLLRKISPRKKAVKQDAENVRIASLTEREREVIKLAGKGLKNRQIAEKLFLSDITVHHHLTSIYSKLKVADRLELLIYSYRNNLAELPR